MNINFNKINENEKQHMIRVKLLNRKNANNIDKLYISGMNCSSKHS